MIGPVSALFQLPGWVDLLFALFVGIAFGYALEQGGFSSSRKLAGMFYGYDTTVLKVFFTAALVALVGARLLSFFGLLDLDLVFVNEYYVNAAIAGGVIMGLGFIMGGFCPGTGVCAASIGKTDAMVYVLGGVTGAFLFAETWPWVAPLAMKNYKGPLQIHEVLGLSSGLFTLLLIMAAVAMFWLAEKAEKRFARPDIGGLNDPGMHPEDTKKV